MMMKTRKYIYKYILPLNRGREKGKKKTEMGECVNALFLLQFRFKSCSLSYILLDNVNLKVNLADYPRILFPRLVILPRPHLQSLQSRDQLYFQIKSNLNSLTSYWQNWYLG